MWNINLSHSHGTWKRMRPKAVAPYLSEKHGDHLELCRKLQVLSFAQLQLLSFAHGGVGFPSALSLTKYAEHHACSVWVWGEEEGISYACIQVCRCGLCL